MAKINHTRHVLNELLVDLFNYILFIEERNLKDNGVNLSISEVHLIESVYKAENNNITSIASDMLVTKGTFSLNVSRLIKKGYLKKYKDKDDGRIVRVEITDKAKDVLLEHDKFHNTLIDRAISDLNLEDNEVLNQSLHQLLDYFRKEYNDTRVNNEC